MVIIYSDVSRSRCRPLEGENAHSLKAKTIYLKLFDTDNLRRRRGCISRVGEVRNSCACVRDCLPACLPACNRLPRASEWEAMSRSKSCREICRWAPGLRFYRVCLFVSQALPSWGALLRVLFCNPIEIILILDMTEYSRVPQKEGVRESSFAVWLRFMPFTRRNAAHLRKAIFFFFYLRTLQWLRCVGRRQPDSLSHTHTK